MAEGSASWRNTNALAYLFISASTLVINKLAIRAVDGDSVGLLALQLIFTAMVSTTLATKWMPVDNSLTMAEFKSLLLSAVIFCATVYANFQVLATTSVELFIALRASVPIVTAVADWWFLERELPDARSCVALLGICAGVLSYAWDAQSELRIGVVPILAWYTFFVSDQCYLKYVCDTFELSTNTRVFYTNFIAGLGAFACTVFRSPLKVDGMGIVALSCIAGASMSFVSWKAREVMSATSFSVLGVIAKLGSLVLSFLILQTATSVVAASGIVVSILCGAAYRQAPNREARASREPNESLDAHISGVANVF